MKKLRILAIFALVAAAGLSTSQAVAHHNDNTRPGWGFGDVNHVHTGPPGQSVNINHVEVTNSNRQNARTGDASVNGNTTGGNASSGNASNTNSTTTTVNINQ